MTDRKPRISEMDPAVFDGLRMPYVPPETLNISPKLKLHHGDPVDLDPVTLEVVRHGLWNVNDDLGKTIQRISGSPIAKYALDLNPSILTEDAEFVFFGPYMQYMSGVTDTQVKWVLENRSENPGIQPGDMFLSNDPWVGAPHQQDVMLMCPVFHGDELFCWVTNCLHQYDVGGETPGSFCAAAETVFQEGLMVPPIKIVEGETIRQDVEDLYLRASRNPDAVALDLRAQIVANQSASRRIQELIETYGADTVKAVMRRIIDEAETAFIDKMSRIPDGIWRERSYVEGARLDDRTAYPCHIILEKRGSELIFYNEGTADQDGAMNCTYSGWRGAVMVAINQLLCWDQYFCLGGALRHIKFDPTPGTLTCANYPASVSTAPVQAMEIALYPTYNVISKMIYPDPELRSDIMCTGGTSQWPATIFAGTNQWGEPFGNALVDPIGGAIGAFSTGDGISTGGQARTPICKLPNVEYAEQDLPILYLYRKELADSGGAGLHRGGMGAEVAITPHHTDGFDITIIASGMSTPSSIGVMGGYPAAVNKFDLLRDTNVQDAHTKGELIGEKDSLNGEKTLLRLREEGVRQNAGDVFVVSWCGGGGYGDPLSRDFASVQADLDDGTISSGAAAEIFGVVEGPKAGVIDMAASTQRREELRHERLSGRGCKPRLRKGRLRYSLGPALDLREDNEGCFYACSNCDHEIASADENYKDGLLVCAGETSTATPLNYNTGHYVDDQISFRRFICPSCATVVETEIARSSDPVLKDIELDWSDEAAIKVAAE